MKLQSLLNRLMFSPPDGKTAHAKNETICILDGLLESETVTEEKAIRIYERMLEKIQTNGIRLG